MAQGFLQIAIFCALIVAVTPLLGGYMARVFRGERTFLDAVAGPPERLTYRLLRIDPTRGQDWKAYARSVIAFSLAGWLVLFLILRTQTLHPFNPEGFHSGTWDLSFNTASSFVTNTNWQYYGGESTLSYFSQMAGLTAQNFVSAATGIAVAIALIRGIIARRSATPTLGNFWQDLVRACFYVLLPISIIGAVLLVSQGVLQTLGGTVAGIVRG
jgi:potassium-transporting ATPase potassium-binding subunit